MFFTYQKYYLRLFIGGLLVVGLCIVESWIWFNIKPPVNNNLFIPLTVAIMFAVINVMFKYIERFVVRSGKIIVNSNNTFEVVLCKKVYKMKKIYEATFYTFKIYGVKIGEIYIEFEDEKFKKRKCKIFSEDLHNKKFVDTSLYKEMHLKIPNMNELKD